MLRLLQTFFSNANETRGSFLRNAGTAVILTSLLISCAGQRAPDGGPIDTEPPYVASTVPPNYTTRFHGNSITLEFNKYVDHRTMESAVFVSPSLGQLQFDWSGRDVEIRFTGTLRRNMTYVVTVGTDVADLNNHNKMAQSYTLAFTTGEDIDHGAIAGKIFTQKESDSPVGIMVFAYKLDGLKPDTLDPRTTKPDYVTQSGKDGGFLLQHLTFGSYRVIAVRDEFKNLLYDPETDEYGTQPDEIVLTPGDTLKAGVWMKLGKEDTTAIRLTKASAANSRHLSVEFSSPIDTAGLSPASFSITDTLTGKLLSVLSVCPSYPTRRLATGATARPSGRSPLPVAANETSGPRRHRSWDWCPEMQAARASAMGVHVTGASATASPVGRTYSGGRPGPFAGRRRRWTVSRIWASEEVFSR